jgi:hypothetical protein
LADAGESVGTPTKSPGCPRSARSRSTAPSRAAHALSYLSIDSLRLYKKNKSVIGAQQSVPTGPVVIDQNNIGDIVDEVKAGLR